LSMKYHQRHLERFTFGVVAGVVLLAAGGLWGFIAWQNGTYLPNELVSDQVSIDASSDSTVTWETQPPVQETVVSEPVPTVNLRAGVSRMLTPQSEAMPVEEVPTVEQAALESSAGTEKMMPDQAAIAAQAELTASIEAKNLALQAEREKLEQERHLLKKKLAAERAENERLKLESEREHERALKAQSMVKEARRNTRLSWDKINASTPDAFPEE
jgi:hypothetical protein